MYDHREQARVRQISVGGQVVLVSTFPRHSLNTLRSYAWDPATNLAYYANSNGIFQLNPEGVSVPLLGQKLHAGYTDARPMDPCLRKPRGLHILGSYLFIADTDNQSLRMFNLQTKRLLTLVGYPYEPRTRLGPLGFSDPSLSYLACAALRRPLLFALNADGACLMLQDHALLHLDLSAFAIAVPEPVSDQDWDPVVPAGPASGVAAAAVPAASVPAAAVPASSVPAASGSERKRRASGEPEAPRKIRSQPPGPGSKP